jgi:ABC-type ATPase involved in cell division
MYHKYLEAIGIGAVRKLENLTDSNGLTILGGSANSGKNAFLRMMVEINEIERNERSLIIITETREENWIKYPSCTNAVLRRIGVGNFENAIIKICREAIALNVQHIFIENLTRADCDNAIETVDILRNCIKYFGVTITAATHIKRDH